LEEPRTTATDSPLSKHVLHSVVASACGFSRHGYAWLKRVRRDAHLAGREALCRRQGRVLQRNGNSCRAFGLRMLRDPCAVMEKRPPSINLFRRVPQVVKSLARLTWAFASRASVRRPQFITELRTALRAAAYAARTLVFFSKGPRALSRSARFTPRKLALRVF